MSARGASIAALLVLLVAVAAPAGAGPAGAEPADTPVARIETRSADLLAVGTVHGQRMTLHLSRLIDNAPVRDAAVTVVLRGAAHAATADADGGYSIETADLAVPGAAAVKIQVDRAGARVELSGTLDVPGPPDGGTGPSSATRQYGWWLLNFAVCIGFLMLWRRRKVRDG